MMLVSLSIQIIYGGVSFISFDKESKSKRTLSALILCSFGNGEKTKLDKYKLT